MGNKILLNAVTLALFLLFAVILFNDLSDNALCNDEAFTAVMARNVLQFGYPRAFDGINLIYPTFPQFIMPGSYLWIADSWVQFYITAFSFAVFGINTWSARFPFVMACFATLILLYLLSVRYLNSKAIGLISVLLLGTSVPFLLHSRQCRYYALVILLCLAIFYSYCSIAYRRRGYLCLALLFIILSWTNHAAFVPIFISIWLMALLIDSSKIDWKKFTIASVVSLVFLSGWLSIWWPTFMYDRREYPLGNSLVDIKKNLEFQIRTINSYFMPVVFWAVFVFLLKVSKKLKAVKLSENEKVFFKRIIVIILSNIIFFSIFGMRTMRYYVQYLPFLCLLEAILILKIFHWRKILAMIILALLIFTNFLSRLDKPRTYFLDYLYEITHEYTGPMEALCGYLDKHARPGDKIKIVKGDLEVMFCHPELIILNDERYFKKTYPEWIVIRKYWNPIYESIWKNELGVKIEEGYLDVLDRYRKISLPAVDSIRENEPDNLETHFFRSPAITPENQMFVYHIREHN